MFFEITILFFELIFKRFSILLDNNTSRNIIKLLDNSRNIEIFKEYNISSSTK